MPATSAATTNSTFSCFHASSRISSLLQNPASGNTPASDSEPITNVQYVIGM